MALIDQSIKTLFNGVSRQPDHVRLPGQVQDAENVEISVITGGFGKRPGSRLAARLLGYQTTDFRTHWIVRDAAERYCVFVYQGSLQVLDLVSGTLRAISYQGSASAYLNAAPADLVLTTAADYTLIANKDKTVRMDGTITAPGGVFAAVLTVKQTYQGTYDVIINGANVCSHSVVTSGAIGGQGIASDSPGTTAAYMGAKLRASLPSWTIDWTDNYIFISNGSDFTISTGDPGSYVALCKDVVADTSALPAKALGGMVVKVVAGTSKGYWLKFVATNGSAGVWTETAEPGGLCAFDASTMPHALVRNADGTFTVKPLAWNQRAAGADVAADRPGFVDRTITDITFFRERLVLTAGETAVFSAVGDFFNFWPQRTTQLTDADPFGRNCATDQVSIIRYAIPFRKTLFLTSDTAQFELSAPEALTPTKTVVDKATAYPLAAGLRPVPIGDSIFMVSYQGSNAAVLEYTYDYQTTSNTAVDVAKHVAGYIPKPIVLACGDATAGMVFLVPEGTPRNTIKVYNYFWQGDQRQQSAWHTWSFDVAKINGMTVIDGVLFMAVSVSDAVHVVTVDLGHSAPADTPYRVCVDQAKLLAGTYVASDAGTTYWDIPYPQVAINRLGAVPTGPMASHGTPVLFQGVGDPPGRVRATGDWSQSPSYIGLNFLARVEFAKQFVRGQDGASVLSGRLQLQKMTLAYADTGSFTVNVIPEGREERDWLFNARTVGRADNLAGPQPIRSGTFRFHVGSRGDTVRIAIRSDGPLPFTIISAEWTGLYNSISRQG